MLSVTQLLKYKNIFHKLTTVSNSGQCIIPVLPLYLHWPGKSCYVLGRQAGMATDTARQNLWPSLSGPIISKL